MVLAHNIEEGNRTCDVQIVQNVTFDTMLLTSNTLDGLKQSGFYRPSPVQLHGIPLGKCGFDLLLEAKSGTGKTAVFTVITLEKLDLEKGLQTVILAPTREIASQISDVIKQIGSFYEGLCVEVVMGGLPVEDDICKFKNTVHVVVGSPGRLRHLIQDKHIDVSSVRLLILDEADKLMEKSFKSDINYIFSVLPTQKQVIMSSATYPETTKGFINKYVKCAQHVCPNNNCVLLGVEQKRTVVKFNTNIVRQTNHRFEELLKILTKIQFKQCLIFCNYQARVAEVYKLLTREKWPVEQMCGQQEQTDRLDALKILKEYKCRILVSTDLAARGIDASNVDLVIHFEPPSEWQTYLHRIGRAGRYGSYGLSISILSQGKEEDKFNNILEAINLDTLKVSYLWENYDSQNNAGQTKLSQNQVNPQNDFTPTNLENIYNDVWNNLIGMCDNNETEDLEEFESLCKSFELSNQLKIESFTDLVNSFENSSKNNTPAVIETYQHTKAKTKAFKSFFLSMKALKDSNYNRNTRPSMEKTKESNNNLPDVLNNEYIRDTASNTTNMPGPDNTVSVQDNVANHNNMKCTGKHDKEFTIDINTNSDLNGSRKALTDAGLPSSFGTSKNHHYKNKNGNKIQTNNSYHTINRESKNEYHNTENEQNYNKNFPTLSVMNIKLHKKDEVKSKKLGCKDNPYYTSDYKNNSNHVRRDSTSTNSSRLLHEVVFNQGTLTENYKNWYYNLKNRVKQIEIALYIEELTKL